ncbi:PREDICTED: RNA polymerase II C-terminal domain phosphatase-like 4 [Tarenaya hassleriana]|uniref:RNA polymerase II C-terminal domain phosphatase-like 4 n=1 Tax=Tarenaya hassleriana TaxID=28532 RepID=UPI00053C7D4B|nr:PREDICTED: RNA polymerase II C-terminal domain phosphatase-like 4 [Tarenaya hassleriana]
MPGTDIQVSSSIELRDETWKIDLKTDCDHWFVCDEICCQCKSAVSNSKARPFRYLAKGLQLTHEAVGFIKRKRSEIYLAKKKLHLVLDLDHTLVQTCEIWKLSRAWKHLIEEADSRDDLWRIYLEDSGEILVKLRPFVREFLREASELFSMNVYTMAGPTYAERVVKLLDPSGDYFGRRIITRRDSCNKRKSLDLVLAEERHVVIVDDRRGVWPDHGRNLIKINGYDYFKESERCRMGKREIEEREKDGALASVLEKLVKLHGDIFDDAKEEKLRSRDVRSHWAAQN